MVFCYFSCFSNISITALFRVCKIVNILDQGGKCSSSPRIDPDSGTSSTLNLVSNNPIPSYSGGKMQSLVKCPDKATRGQDLQRLPKLCLHVAFRSRYLSSGYKLVGTIFLLIDRSIYQPVTFIAVVTRIWNVNNSVESH